MLIEEHMVGPKTYHQPAIRNPQSAIGTRHREEAAPTAFSNEDMLAARLRVSKVLPYQRSITPFISNLSLAITSGLLLVFAFPEWNLWSLGWVATAPLIMAVVREQRFWRSLLLGYVTGTVFYVGSSHWITYTMNHYAEIPLWLSYLIGVFFASTLGIFTGLFAGVLGLGVKRFGGWAILGAPVIWAASEWARITAVGVGWNALGYSQAFQPAVIQIARWGGVYLVSALLVAASTALVFAMVYLERRRGLIVLTIAILLGMASVLYGQSLRPEGDEEGSVSVAVIQPYVPIDGAWHDRAFVDQLTDRHLQLSEQAIKAKMEGVDLVIWPESPMSFEYERDSALRLRLAQFTKRNEVYLLMSSWGVPEADHTEGIYNSAMVIAPSGQRVARYDKVALVPFGEYVPLRDYVPFMNRIPALVYDITPGTSFTLGDVAGAKVGTLICFEATRPDIAREMRKLGASVLTQISNELWYNSTAAARQMLAHAVFRAVENNVELIRATNSGLSARIDRYGVVHDETPMFETATRLWKAKTTDEAASHRMTLYTRYGDLFAVTCAGLSLLLAIAAIAPKKSDE